MRRLTNTPVSIRDVAYLPDGRLLSVCGKKSVTVWDTAAGVAVGRVKTNMFACALAVAPNGVEVAVAGRGSPSDDESQILIHRFDGTALGRYCVWPITRRSAWDRNTRSIWSLAYSGDGEFLTAARREMGGGNMYDGGDARWWRTRSWEFGDFTPAPRAYSVGAAKSGGRFLITGESEFLMFDHPERPAVRTHRFDGAWATAVAYLPNGVEAVVGKSSFLLYTDRLTEKGNLVPLKTSGRAIHALAVSPDGTSLLVGGAPGQVERYDLSTRERVVTYDFDVGPVQSLAFAPDGLTFAVGAEQGLILVDVE